MPVHKYKFGVLSTQDILNMSVVNISQLTNPRGAENIMYDNRMGPTSCNICPTCGLGSLECIGHFGHMVFARPVPNPIFTTILMNILGSCCFVCKKIMFLKPKQNRSSVGSLRCPECGTTKPVISQNKGWFFKDGNVVSPEDVYALLDKLPKTSPGYHPRDLMFNVFPVIPPLARPCLNLKHKVSEDDLTALYSEIFRLSSSLEDSKYEKLVSRVHTLINNSGGISKHPCSGRTIKGIIERLSGKNGIFRNNCLGKRCGNSARAVAAPGPDLLPWEVGVPERIAKILVVPHTCTEHNLQMLQDKCDKGQVDSVTRMMDGRRQEYLVKKFCTIPQTRIKYGDVLVLPSGELVTPTGHEILTEQHKIIRNGEYIPIQLKSTRNFKICIGDVVYTYLYNGVPVLVNRQPTLFVGGIIGLLTKIIQSNVIRMPLCCTKRLNLDFDGDEINIHAMLTEEALREVWARASPFALLLSPNDNFPLTMPVQDAILGLYKLTEKNTSIPKIWPTRDGSMMTTFDMVSSCLPTQLSFKNDQIIIVKGQWIFGKLTSSNLVELLRALMPLGCRVYILALAKLEKLGTTFISYTGHSVHRSDFFPIKLEYPEVIDDNLTDYLHSQVRDKLRPSGLVDYIKSGTKGKILNICCLVGTIGQQVWTAGSIFTPNFSNNRVLLQDDHTISSLVRGGFVHSCFAGGVNWREYMTLCFPARSSIVSTATGTASTGYCQRRLGKFCEDVISIKGMIVMTGNIPKYLKLE